MKVKELIKELKTFGQDKEVLIASDEELNSLFTGLQVADYGMEKPTKEVVIYGLSGTEKEEEPLEEFLGDKTNQEWL